MMLSTDSSNFAGCDVFRDGAAESVAAAATRPIAQSFFIGAGSIQLPEPAPLSERLLIRTAVEVFLFSMEQFRMALIPLCRRAAAAAAVVAVSVSASAQTGHLAV